VRCTQKRADYFIVDERATKMKRGSESLSRTVVFW